MKKFFGFVLVMMFTVSAVFAQESEKLRFGNVLGNRFADNWELTVAGGHNYSAYVGLGFKDQGKFVDNFGWTAELSATKWFNPVIGTRIQVGGGQLEARGGKSWFVTPHLDVVANLSNWIGGYKEDRVYYANVFAGAGAQVVDLNNGANAGMIGVVGLNNVFRVSPTIDINLELKGLVGKQDDMPLYVAHYGKVGQVYTATVGLTYRFGGKRTRRDFEAAAPMTAALAYMSMIDKLETDNANKDKAIKNLANRTKKDAALIEKLVNDNKALNEQIKNHRCPEARVVSTAMVYFDFDSYVITDKSEVTLNALATAIKNSPADQKFTITGHADAHTGTNEYNLKLSEKRAEAVYNYLVEHGVDKDKLTWVGNGPTKAYHKNARANRMAYIK
jgi:outer membrane protein OmpA-like peptidoglycan-associated protein